MSEVARQRKQKKRKEAKDEAATPKAKDEPSKEEYSIANWMRKNIPTKKTKFLSHTVEYFTACKAVDQLMDSPWAKAPKSGEEALFTSRESIVDYLEVMLRHKMFHRARKIIVPESELKSKKKKDKEKEAVKEKEKEKEKEPTPALPPPKEDKEKESKKDNEATVTAAESSQAEGEKVEEGDKGKKKQKKKEEGEKKKRKIRLDMHLEQFFVDGLDAYVWIYEPTPYYYYFFGFLVVIAVIAVCLFPLWPSSVRQGVYYLSLGAAGFLVFILALAVIRLIGFCIVWGLTLGRHHLWLLPNLTEDVGFLQSFWPLYKHETNYRVDEPENDNEENDSVEGNGKTNASDEVASEADSGQKPKADSTVRETELKNSTDQSETESEGSQRSQTGKDFEIVDRDEINDTES